MIERLQKRNLTIMEELTSDELVTEVTKQLLPLSSLLFKKEFDKLNLCFFNGTLPSCLIIELEHRNTVGGSCIRARASPKLSLITVDKYQGHFTSLCILLHEMQHYSNFINDIEEDDHGRGWAESLKPIHEALNLKIDPHSLTDAELRSWPQLMFQNYGLDAYMEQAVIGSGLFNPLPDTWVLKKLNESLVKENVFTKVARWVRTKWRCLVTTNTKEIL